MKRFAVLLLCGVASVGLVRAQKPATTVPAWQQAAGDTMAFEVASIREDKGSFKPPSFALSSDEWFRDPHGRFHADFKLPVYIEFAYKIWLTGDEERAMVANLPDWVRSTRFDIEATAPPNATKDQYRVMMQKLLAERFGAKIHFEQKELPVLAMLLVKPGKPGPRLIPHDQGQPCDETPKPTTYPKQCYSFAARPIDDGMWLTGSRASSMNQIAMFVGSFVGNSGEIGRRVVDQTGLTGLWDITLEAAQPGAPPSAQQQTVGPTALEVVRDQLGVKLKATRAVVSEIVVDHIDRPTEN
jgi:uncharacterized protein (TIGR03435 family)